MQRENLVLRQFSLFAKLKQYLRTELVTFEQSSSNYICQQGVFSDLKSFLLISDASWFSFFAIEYIRQPPTTENFDKLIFRSVKTIYLIQSSLKKILLDHDTNLNALLKVIHETQHLSLKVAFLVIKAKMVLR